MEKFGLEWNDGEPGDATGVAELEEDGCGGFYEDIQAPKFVDFTVPDCSRPDDRSWFCDRVGCDQNHEEVDPEALDKSFVLRVMAARSPNVRFQKAVGAPSLIPKCPQSAPVKAVKSRIMMSTMTSIPEKMVKSRLNHHPITMLRSNPSSKKENEQTFIAKKAFTTPRNKRCPTKPEPFLSVKNQKTVAGALKDKNVAKVLFSDIDSTKDVTEVSSPLKSHTATNVSEVCAEMKKLKIGRKIVPSRYLDISKGARASKKTEESNTNSKTTKESCKSLRITDLPTKNLRKKIANPSKGCNLPLLQEISGKKSNDMDKDLNPINMTQSDAAIGDNISSFPNMLPNEAPQPTIGSSKKLGTTESLRKTEDIKEERDKVLLALPSSRLTSEIQTAEDTTDYDENKENASAQYGARSPGSNSRNCTRKKLQSVATEYFGKTYRYDSKPCKHPFDQGAKNKRTTSTKPFRLRTNERGILKEANVERTFKTNSNREVEPVMKKDEGSKHNGKASQEKNNKISLLDRQKQNTRFGIPADSKIIPEKLLPQKSIANDRRMTKKPHNRVQTLPSSSTLVTLSNKSQGSFVEKDSNKARSNANNVRGKRPTTVSKEAHFQSLHLTNIVRGKRPTTVSKEPNFQKLHLPKGCFKRVDVVI